MGFKKKESENYKVRKKPIESGAIIVQKKANKGKEVIIGHWVGLITEANNGRVMVEWVDIEAPPDYLPLFGISTVNLHKEYTKFDLFPDE